MGAAITQVFAVSIYMATEEVPREFGDIVFPRLVRQITKYEGADLHIELCDLVRDFAIHLTSSKRYKDAARVLNILKGSLFWVAFPQGNACLFVAMSNIAIESRLRSDYEAALKVAEQIPASQVDEVLREGIKSFKQKFGALAPAAESPLTSDRVSPPSTQSPSQGADRKGRETKICRACGNEMDYPLSASHFESWKKGICPRCDRSVGGGSLSTARTSETESPKKISLFPLHEAVKRGDRKAAQLLLANRVNVNAGNETDWTPLRIAVWENDRDMVELLLANKADANAKYRNDDAPLHIVRRADIAKLLLAGGADLNARNEWGSTPYENAASWYARAETESERKQFGDLVEVLRASGADVTRAENLDRLKASGEAEAWLWDHYKRFSDYSAEERDAFRAWLRNSPYWPLHEKRVSFHLDELWGQLFELGGRDGLCRAAGSGDMKKARRLLELTRKKILNAVGVYSGTPLNEAVHSGQREMTEFLLSNGANPNGKDGHGRTPLDIALEDRSSSMAELLLANGADVNAVGWIGRTPLDIALEDRSSSTAELLIANGADVKAVGRNGRTPLHRAAERGAVGIAELLLANGADVNAEGQDGRTPLYVAMKERQGAVARLLREHGGRGGLNLWERIVSLVSA